MTASLPAAAKDERTRGLLDRPGVDRLMTLLNDDEDETRIVGGAVRDALLGLAVGDVDLTTTLRPEAVIERAAAVGLGAIPTGIEHGTVTVVVAGHPFEVTTLREDVETDGRRAVVRFGHDFDLDARRRDFTVNALSLDARGALHDPVGGLSDLEVGRIRFIGEAGTRIREDYLRILRFFRFSARYAAGSFDAEGLEAAARLAAGIDQLSRERVGQEMRKLLVAPRAADALEAMSTAGLMVRVLGPAATDISVERFRTAITIAHQAGQAPDALLGLKALLGSGEAADADSLREALRLSNAEQDRLGALGAAWALITAGRLDEARYRFPPAVVADARLLAAAASSEPVDPAEIVRLRTTSPPGRPFAAADLMRRGFEPGPALGMALKRAEQAWIEAGFPSDAMEVERLLDEAAVLTDAAGLASGAPPG